MLRRLLAALALLATACAVRVPAREAMQQLPLEIEGNRFLVLFQAEDEEAAELLTAALRQAVPRLARFAALRAPVTLTVHPTRESLAAASSGYHWLRAWAQYSRIDILAPRAWGWQRQEGGEAPDPERFKQLVLHELTHCAMYQTATSEWSWNVKLIPAWFREGMASVLAGEGSRRMPVRDLRRFYQRPGPGAEGPRRAGDPRAGGDPLSDPEPLLAEESEVVYGAAHLAFQFLVTRYGDERVRAILGRMGSGAFFPSAFREAIGITPEAFEADFRRYVLWRGWGG